MAERAFLHAEWRKLAMANYAVDPDLLHKVLKTSAGAPHPT